MITERKLKKWRKEALTEKNISYGQLLVTAHKELQSRILQMTQELLDQYIIEKDKKENA